MTMPTQFNHASRDTRAEIHIDAIETEINNELQSAPLNRFNEIDNHHNNYPQPICSSINVTHDVSSVYREVTCLTDRKIDPPQRSTEDSRNITWARTAPGAGLPLNTTHAPLGIFHCPSMCSGGTDLAWRLVRFYNAEEISRTTHAANRVRFLSLAKQGLSQWEKTLHM